MITLHILYIIPLLCCFGVGVFALLKARQIAQDNRLFDNEDHDEFTFNKNISILFFLFMWFPLGNIIALLIYVVFNVVDYFTNI